MTYDLLVKNASELLTCHAESPKRKEELNNLSLIKNGAVLINKGRIIAVDKSSGFGKITVRKTIDAKGCLVMPGFVDPHTHLVFAGGREDEFEDKLAGKSYLEILKAGGGIYSTVAKTRSAGLPSLINNSLKKLDLLLSFGTTTVEIKTGYGLSYEEEHKLLIGIEELRKHHPIDIVKTFLGAHVYPHDKTEKEYRLELFRMIADFSFDFCDIFLEKGAFSLRQAREILQFAAEKKKKIKIHAGQFNDLEGSSLAVRLKATSVDHLDHISGRAISELAGSETVGVLLPGVSFFLKAKKLPPVRKMIERGMALALASDFNPGSCPSFNIQLMIAFACNFYGILPAQAINMATINSAFAIDLGDKVGSISSGKQADILILDIDTYRKLPYFFGNNHVKTVIKKGKIIDGGKLRV